MFDFFRLLLAEGDNTGDSTWYIWVILGAFFLLLIGTQVLNSRKRQKQVQDMMANLTIGSEVKTIGGFVGVVVAMDEQKGLLTLNIGTVDSPTYAVIDRAGIYNIVPVPIPEAPAQLEAPKAQLPEGETTKQATASKTKTKVKKEDKEPF